MPVRGGGEGAEGWGRSLLRVWGLRTRHAPRYPPPVDVPYRSAPMGHSGLPRSSTGPAEGPQAGAKSRRIQHSTEATTIPAQLQMAQPHGWSPKVPRGRGSPSVGCTWLTRPQGRCTPPHPVAHALTPRRRPGPAHLRDLLELVIALAALLGRLQRDFVVIHKGLVHPKLAGLQAWVGGQPGTPGAPCTPRGQAGATGAKTRHGLPLEQAGSRAEPRGRRVPASGRGGPW